MSLENIISLGLCALLIGFIISVFLNVVLFSHRNRLNRDLKNAEARLNILASSALEDLRMQWIKELTSNIYRNEIEVEIKFIYPLLRFLGWEPNEIQIRASVEVQVGRQRMGVYADWVILRDGKPYFIVEAKESNQPLTDEVLAQARSYAYGLGTSTYMVTNGNMLEIHSRGIEADMMLVRCSVDELENQWEKIKDSLGKKLTRKPPFREAL